MTPGFLLLLALLWYLDNGVGLLLWGLAACAAHETGHIAALRLMGRRPRTFRLTAAGAELDFGSGLLPYRKEWCAALAGPLANLILAAIAARAGLFLLSGLSFGIGLFNFLPVIPLDGGRALSCVLSPLLGVRSSERTVLTVSRGVTAGLLGLGVFLLLRFSYPALFITAVWLACAMR